MEKRKAGSPLGAVVFDLDGTLADSLADIASAVNATLASRGRPGHPVEAYKAMVGWGLKQLLVTAANPGFDSTELEAAYQQVLGEYRARPVIHTVAYPGIETLLAGLKGRVRLGVFSNKEDTIAKAVVSTLFPAAFSEAVGARPGVPHKPDPAGLTALLTGWGVEPGRCAYLGDSDVDMETARRAGVIACGASWGFRGEAELRAAGAEEVFADAAAFGRWLEGRLD
jgi:phosphoglycolate phosphatase